MNPNETKAQKLAHLRRIETSEDRFFYDYSQEIEAYLADEDPEVRALAVQCLWDYPGPAHIDVLINLAENDPSSQVRQRALSTLGRYVYEGEMADYDFDFGPYDDLLRENELPQADFERVCEYLLSVIKHEGRPLDERRRAIEAISFHHTPEVLDIIEQAYHHPDNRMKVSAVFAMGRNGNLKRWEKYLLEALYSPVPEIEYEAVCAAGECTLESANRQLMRLARGAEDKDLRMAAIWSIGQIGLEESFELLDNLRLLDPDEEIREVAEAAFDEWMIFSQLHAFDNEDWFGEDLDEELE